MRAWMLALGGLTLMALLAWLWVGLDVKGAASAGPAVARPLERPHRTDTDTPSAEAQPVRAQVEASSAADAMAAQREPVEAVPEPAPVNRLTITVLDPRGAPWAGGKLRLRAPGRLTARLPQPDATTLPDGESLQATGGVDTRGTYSLLHLDDGGVVELTRLEPDAAYEVAAVDPIGGEGARLRCPGLGPAEQREALLVLERLPTALHGRCVDESGAPLEGAQVVYHSEHLGRGVKSGPDGRFATAPLFATRVSMSAKLDEHVSARLEHVDPADGEVTLVLRRGRTLRVELRDTLGRPVGIGALTARVPGTDSGWSGHGDEDGLREISGLPRVPLTLEYELDGLARELAIDADSESVVFEVPALGLLEVQVGRLTAAEGEEFSLHVRSLDDPDREPRSRTVFAHGRSFVSWPLWPGNYELQLGSWRVDGSDANPVLRPYGSPLTVEVTAGATTSVQMGS